MSRRKRVYAQTRLSIYNTFCVSLAQIRFKNVCKIYLLDILTIRVESSLFFVSLSFSRPLVAFHRPRSRPEITRNYKGFYSKTAMFRFIALYVVAGRVFIYQYAIPVAFRAWMAVRNSRKLRSCEQMEGVSGKKRTDGKITIGSSIGCPGIPFLLSVDS